MAIICFLEVQFQLSFVLIVILMAIAAAVETMRTELALRHTYGLHEIFQAGELQRRQSQTLGNLCHHPLILRRIRLRILLEILLVVALKVLDDTTRDQFHIALRRSEVDKRTAIHQRRT